jgi:predicted Zn-dependent protease
MTSYFTRFGCIKNLNFIFFTVLFVVCSCATNPVTKRKQLVFMSQKKEVAIGKAADPQIIAEFGLYEDKVLQDFINEKGKAMAAISHRSKLQYHFRIVDSEVLNAFAVPGGYVYFTRGIMGHFNNEAEFAGVLGHEIGHISARHSVKQHRDQILAQVGIIGGIILAPELAQFADAAAQGIGLLLLKFSRNAERQSDKLGVEYSSKIGYDAKEMAGFFKTLERQSGGRSGELPNFLSTHPNPGDRDKDVSKLAQEWKGKLKLTNAQINRNSYLNKIDGLIYGEDPKQGFVENNVFYHPGLMFQVNIPTGWSTQNSPSQFQMAPANGKAMMILTMGKGKSLNEAAAGFLQQNNLQALEAKEIMVNSLPVLAVLADTKQQSQQQQPLRTLSHFIQYGENIFLIIGVAGKADFNNYVNMFSGSQQSFSSLSDVDKLNKKPERIRIKTVNSSATLEEVFRSSRIDEKRFEELAILNGMKLTDGIEAGTMIKLVGE